MKSMKELNWVQLALVIAGAFMCYFLADGYTYSVGLFYPYFLEAFTSSDTSTAVLPGLLYAVPQMTSPFLCQLLSVYGYSSGAAWAAVLLCLSCIGSSLAPSIGILYFTFGVMTSVGLQMTYSSAIMAVTVAFKDSRFFGPAVGLAMCGSGIGSFATTPMLNSIMAVWTWRGALVIEAAILLNVMVAAACFHHVDAIEFQNQVIRRGKTVVRLQTVHSSSEIANVNDPTDPHSSHFDVKCSSWSIWRYLLLLPSRLRFQSVTDLPPGGVVDPITLKQETVIVTKAEPPPGFREFLNLFVESMRQLVSPELWGNRRLLCYILANGITGAGIVIPYTYLPHHVQLAFEGLSTEAVQADSGWLVSLIGLGALVGQIVFGLATFQYGDTRQLCCHSNSFPPDEETGETLDTQSCPEVEEHSSGAASQTPERLSNPPRNCCPSRLIILFMGTLLWNSLFTLAIAWMSLEWTREEVNSIFELSVGRGLAAVTFLLGISNGGIYVLYPLILVKVAGDKLWPAALSIFLAFNGTMNLTGTLVAAKLFAMTGSYQVAFHLGGLFPLLGLLLCLGQHLVAFACRGRRSTEERREKDNSCGTHEGPRPV